MKSKIKKVILYYNPASGIGLFKNNLDYIIARYQKQGYHVIPIRAAESHSIFDFLSELDQETYKEEYYQIIAAGGDGTINLCVNAMIKNDIDLPLAIFPSGTANDFAYYFDIPNDINKMIDVALSGKFIPADAGKVNDRYFINVAAIGKVVDVSQKTDPVLKNTLGVFAYYIKGITEIPNLKPRRVTLTTPDKVYKEKMYFMVVMNGRAAGGFKNISPNAEINDGMLDIVLFRNMNFLQMPSMFMKIVKGRHSDSGKVLHFKTDELLIEAEDNLPTDIDGERGEQFPLKFSVLHNKMKICVADNKGEENA